MLENEDAAGLGVNVEAASHVVAVKSRGATFDEELGPLGCCRCGFTWASGMGWAGAGAGSGGNGVVEVEVQGVEGAFPAIGGGVGAVAVFWNRVI
jgi:hypothetical protein